MTEEEIVIDESELVIDVASIDFSDIEKKYAVAVPDPLESILIVDNVPVVDEAKEPKLLAVLKKTFNKFGLAADGELVMPMVDGMSKGFLFVDLQSKEKAAEFTKHVNGLRLDKNHVFAVYKFGDFEKILLTQDTYVPPKPVEYKEHDLLTSWLLDENARDQFLTLVGDELFVHWNNGKTDPDCDVHRPNWTDSLVKWSPKGSYMATYHRQGLVLWGTKAWERLLRFSHPNVRFAEFSPNEQYLFTYSNPQAGQENLRFWDVKSGKLLRAFVHVFESNETGAPMVKWSSNSEYFARIGNDILSVFNASTMTLVDGKSIKCEGVSDFDWSPKDSTIAFWAPELGNNPARVSIVEIPSKAIVRTKNLYLVSECKLFWHSEGDYLCVIVEKHTKTKKSTYSTLEVFSLREKDVPIDVYEGFKDLSVSRVEWEPSGDRFVAIVPDQSKILLKFFKMERSSLKELQTIDRKNMSNVIWSPKGRFLVLAALRNYAGDLEFFDADEMQTLHSAEHFQATNVDWDPTGRYVVTYSSFLRNPGDNGFAMWDFRGQQMFKRNIPKFKLFSWRPRPETLLSKDQIKNIRKNLKQYSEKFDEIDSKALGAADNQALAERTKLLNEWNSWRAACLKRYESQREERAKVRGGDDEPEYSDVEEALEDVEEFVEEVIEEYEEEVGEDDEE